MNARLILGTCTVATLAVTALAVSRADDSDAHGVLTLQASAVDGAAHYQIRQISCDGRRTPEGFTLDVTAHHDDRTVSVPVGCYRVDLQPPSAECDVTPAIDVPVHQSLATSVTLFADCAGAPDLT